MRRAISFLLALVFCFSLACNVCAATNSPGQSGSPVISGGNTWYKGSNGGMSVSIKGANGDVEEVKVGNKTLGSGDYTVTKNSDGTVTVTLSKEYLETLSAGTYTLKVCIDGQWYSFTFRVTNAGASYDGNPKTGDTSRMGLWVPMLIASALALVALVAVYFKKFRKVN